MFSEVTIFTYSVTLAHKNLCQDCIAPSPSVGKIINFCVILKIVLLIFLQLLATPLSAQIVKPKTQGINGKHCCTLNPQYRRP